MGQLDDYTVKEETSLDSGLNNFEYEGKLLVSEETIAQISFMAIKKVEGVLGLVTSASDEFQNMMGSNRVRGVKVEVGEKEAIIDLNICVAFDIDVKKITNQVRQIVAYDVFAMTGINVIEININIGEISNIVDAENENLGLTEDDFQRLFDDNETRDIPGKITFSEYVPAAIASKVALEVSGVAAMNRGIAGELAGYFSDRLYAQGVKVELGQREMIIDLFVDIVFGERIPDVSWNIQEKVKNAVESFTGLSVKEVNVSVQGIYFDEEKDE